MLIMPRLVRWTPRNGCNVWTLKTSNVSFSTLPLAYCGNRSVKTLNLPWRMLAPITGGSSISAADSNGRLLPIAHIPFGIPELAEQELRRTAKDGIKGFYSAPFIWSRKIHGHPDHHRIFAAAQELGLPFGLHPSFEPHWAAPTRFGLMTGRDTAFFQNVALGNVIREGFTSLFQYGVFDKFPTLQVVILEIGAGWIGYWLDRMDAVYESPIGKSVPLKEKPSFYFKRQCWVSGDPDERSLAGVIPFVGEDRFFWASDFPHADHPPKYIPNLLELVNLLPASARPKILGQNVLQCYGLS